MKLGWYSGRAQRASFQVSIARIPGVLVPAVQRIVTLGSSGGGFAALYCTAALPGATAVPVDLRTGVARCSPKIGAHYADVARGGTGPDPASSASAMLDAIEIYRYPVTSRVWHIPDLGDESHAREHFTPFSGPVLLEDVTSAVLEVAGRGHVPPSKIYVRGAAPLSALRAALDATSRVLPRHDSWNGEVGSSLASGFHR